MKTFLFLIIMLSLNACSQKSQETIKEENVEVSNTQPTPVSKSIDEEIMSIIVEYHCSTSRACKQLDNFCKTQRFCIWESKLEEVREKIQALYKKNNHPYVACLVHEKLGCSNRQLRNKNLKGSQDEIINFFLSRIGVVNKNGCSFFFYEKSLKDSLVVKENKNATRGEISYSFHFKQKLFTELQTKKDTQYLAYKNLFTDNIYEIVSHSDLNKDNKELDQSLKFTIINKISDCNHYDKIIYVLKGSNNKIYYVHKFLTPWHFIH